MTTGCRTRQSWYHFVVCASSLLHRPIHSEIVKLKFELCTYINGKTGEGREGWHRTSNCSSCNQCLWIPTRQNPPMYNPQVGKHQKLNLQFGGTSSPKQHTARQRAFMLLCSKLKKKKVVELLSYQAQNRPPINLLLCMQRKNAKHEETVNRVRIFS